MIRDADLLLYSDFKKEPGEMNSPEDVYSWLDEKRLQLQNKLEEERKGLSAGRYTLYYRAKVDSVRYYEEENP